MKQIGLEVEATVTCAANKSTGRPAALVVRQSGGDQFVEAQCLVGPGHLDRRTHNATIVRHRFSNPAKTAMSSVNVL